jgi:hypothetical protein
MFERIAEKLPEPTARQLPAGLLPGSLAVAQIQALPVPRLPPFLTSDAYPNHTKNLPKMVSATALTSSPRPSRTNKASPPLPSRSLTPSTTSSTFFLNVKPSIKASATFQLPNSAILQYGPNRDCWLSLRSWRWGPVRSWGSWGCQLWRWDWAYCLGGLPGQDIC